MGKVSRTTVSPVVKVVEQFSSHLQDADPLAIEVCLSVMDSNSVYRTEMVRLFDALGARKTEGRLAVLRALYFARDQKMAHHEIRNDVRVTAPNVTKLINGLERDGLVVRVPDVVDRRVTFVAMTPEGRDLAERIVPAIAVFMKESLAGFSEDEKTIFADLLVRFQDNAENSANRTLERLQHGRAGK